MAYMQVVFFLESNISIIGVQSAGVEVRSLADESEVSLAPPAPLTTTDCTIDGHGGWWFDERGAR